MLRDILLFSMNGRVQACLSEKNFTSFIFKGECFVQYEHSYFADWIPIFNSNQLLVGVIIAPLGLGDDEYSFLKEIDFLKNSSNVEIIEEHGYPYFVIYLTDQRNYDLSAMNDPFVELYHNHQGDLIMRIDGYHEAQWDKIGFHLEKEDIPIGIQ